MTRRIPNRRSSEMTGFSFRTRRTNRISMSAPTKKKAELLPQEERRERAEHHHAGVREVDDLHHAVDEREAVRHRRVQASDHERADKGLDEAH
jgi:IMP dehydrogenase/GMP reductase